MSPIAVQSVLVVAVRPHPNADRLDIARVRIEIPPNRSHYQFVHDGSPADKVDDEASEHEFRFNEVDVVVRKDEFKFMDVGIFIPELNVLSPWLNDWLYPPGSSFKPGLRRVRQITIRGVTSAGILIKPDSEFLTLVRKWNASAAVRSAMPDLMRPGQEWSDLLGITAYYRSHCLEHPHLSREDDARLHAARFGGVSRGLLEGRSQSNVDAATVHGPQTITPLGQFVRVLSGVLLLLAIALLLGNAPLLVLGVFVLAMAALGLPLRAPANPVIERTIGKVSNWVDETITVTWNVKLDGGSGAVLVFDELPPEMELVDGTNMRMFWKIPGQKELTHSYSFRCPRRGVYEVGPIQWETRHPLGLRRPVRGNDGAETRITILPPVLAMRRIRNVRALSATPAPMAALARLGIETTDFKEIRQYSPGDPMRIINWKATARRANNSGNPPLVNQYEFEGKKAVWLFVDASEHMQVGTNLRSPLEQAIEAASGLGNYYLRRGYQLGAHFSNKPDHFLSADTGRRQVLRLTQELLELQPWGERYDLLAAIRLCQRQLLALTPRCIIVTRPDVADGSGPLTREANDLLAGVRRLLAFSHSRRSRISVWVVGVRGHGYAQSEPDSVGIAPAVRALETRPFLRELRRTGASVLDWDPAKESFTDVLVHQLRREGSPR